MLSLRGALGLEYAWLMPLDVAEVPHVGDARDRGSVDEEVPHRRDDAGRKFMCHIRSETSFYAILLFKAHPQSSHSISL